LSYTSITNTNIPCKIKDALPDTHARTHRGKERKKAKIFLLKCRGTFRLW